MSKNTNLSFLTDYITADITNGRIGINNASPTVAFDVTGVAKFSSSVTSSFGSSGANFNSNAATTGSVNAYRVSNTTGTGSFGIDNSTGGDLITGGLAYATILQSISNTALQLGTNQTARLTITSGGNVGIGTSSPNSGLGNGLTIDGAGYAPINFSNSGTLRGYLTGYSAGLILASTTGPLVINNTSYNVLVGTTSDNGEKLYISGNVRATGTITANSDISLKKNLLKIENALEKVEQINGYTYELKEDDSKRHAGLIAQEVEIVLPEIVNAGADKIKGIEYGNISALLVEAIKELSTEINIIKKQII